MMVPTSCLPIHRGGPPPPPRRGARRGMRLPEMAAGPVLNNHPFYFCVYVSAFVFKSIFKNNFRLIKIATFSNVVFSFSALKLVYFTIPSK
jgi:hypothetical protein